MELPKMVLFDYGQTLIAEQTFDGVKGTEAVLQYSSRNKYHLTAEQVQAKASSTAHSSFTPLFKHSINHFLTATLARFLLPVQE